MTTSRLEWLKARRDKLRAKVDAFDDASGVPVDYSIDGQSESVGTAVERLEERLNAIEAEIFQLENGGEVITEGFSA